MLEGQAESNEKVADTSVICHDDTIFVFDEIATV